MEHLDNSSAPGPVLQADVCATLFQADQLTAFAHFGPAVAITNPSSTCHDRTCCPHNGSGFSVSVAIAKLLDARCRCASPALGLQPAIPGIRPVAHGARSFCSHAGTEDTPSDLNSDREPGESLMQATRNRVVILQRRKCQCSSCLRWAHLVSIPDQEPYYGRHSCPLVPGQHMSSK